jgi:hypothetical protein
MRQKPEIARLGFVENSLVNSLTQERAAETNGVKESP